MKNMKETPSTGISIKAKVASVISSLLIREAEAGVKHSLPVIIYEPEFPIEMLLEQQE